MTDENIKNEFSENPANNSAESVILINVQQMLSLEIPQRFNRTKTENGWIIHLGEAGRVTVNFLTSMRKFDTALLAGDIVERDGDDLLLIRNQPEDAYRTQRGTSSLARTREQLLSVETTD